MQIEQDRAEMLSGVHQGLTIGSPISLLISNRDWRKGEEVEAVTSLRPGHADLAGAIKYGLEDVRPILERASARDTAARVAAGAVARSFVEQFGIQIHSYTLAIGGQRANYQENMDWENVEASPVRTADPQAEKAMITAIDEAKASGDSVGGVFELIATGVPVGLGSHAHWDRRLDGRIAQAIMSINSVKGVEFGAGFSLGDKRGSQAHDIIEPSPGGAIPWGHATNRAGGIEGGISNGEPIVVRGVVKPIPTLAQPLKSVDLLTGEVTLAHYERSDICVVPAVGVIAEAMLAAVLAAEILEKFGGDHLQETLRNYRSYLDSVEARWQQE
jgi:chorismate synthase